jgi:molybdopterin biosynthesis enzyme
MSRAAIDSPQKAVEATCERLATTATLSRSLLDALGLVLASDATTDRRSPPFDVSAMDGYAVAAASIRAGRVRVAGEARIGTDPGRLDDAAAAIRVATGAGIPRGADAVIRREDVTESDGAFIDVPEATVAACRPGLAVRRAGENAPAGSPLGLTGREIAAHVAASLASAGAATVRVHEPVRVGILTTGDELVNHDATPGPWQIRDSNGPALLAILVVGLVIGILQAATSVSESSVAFIPKLLVIGLVLLVGVMLSWPLTVSVGGVVLPGRFIWWPLASMRMRSVAAVVM